MSVTLFPKYALSASKHQPPSYELTDHVPESAVISRFNESVISVFGDDTWDLSPYSAKRLVYQFGGIGDEKEKPKLTKQLKNEVKQAVFFMLYGAVRFNGNLQPKPISLKAYVSILLDLAECAFLANTNLSTAYKSPGFQLQLKSSLTTITSKHRLLAISRTLAYCIRLQHFNGIEGYDLPNPISHNELSDYQSFISKLVSSLTPNQIPESTPLIPTRILANIITSCEGFIHSYVPFMDGLEKIVKESYSLDCSPAKGIPAGTPSQIKSSFTRKKLGLLRMGVDVQHMQYSTEKYNVITLDDMLKEHNCSSITNHFKEQRKFTFKAMREYLSSIRKACEILIHAFTGMRTHEVKVLPYEFLGKIVIDGIDDVPVVKSYTSKIGADNYSTETIWVTSNNLKPIQKVMNNITRIFHYMNSSVEFNPKGHPTFNSPQYGSTEENYHYNVSMSKIGQYRDEKKNPYPLWFCKDIDIRQEDLDELVAFDVFANWTTNKEFELGKFWPLASHQFRRSVAVYASRSGMVSLPSLGTQYKHLSSVMIQMYAENSSFAQAIFKNDSDKEPHGVITRFQESLDFNAANNFHEKIIGSDKEFSGPSGHRIHKLKKENKLPKIFSSKKETQKAISSGKMKFTETIVGGCMLNGHCDKYGIYDVVPCVDQCKEAILDNSQLELYVEGLELGLELMDLASPQYQVTKREIDKVRNKLSGEAP